MYGIFNQFLAINGLHFLQLNKNKTKRVCPAAFGSAEKKFQFFQRKELIYRQFYNIFLNGFIKYHFGSHMKY